MNEPEITRTLTVEDWSLSVWSGDDEPRVRDLDLAERLGYKRPHDIREQIERRLTDPGFGEVFRTVRNVEKPPTPTEPKFTNRTYGKEYHLTEAQALEIAATSETPNGKVILRALIKVFILARRGMLPGQAQPNAAQLEEMKPEAKAGLRVALGKGRKWAVRMVLKEEDRRAKERAKLPSPSNNFVLRACDIAWLGGGEYEGTIKELFREAKPGKKIPKGWPVNEEEALLQMQAAAQGSWPPKAIIKVEKRVVAIRMHAPAHNQFDPGPKKLN